MTGTAGRGTQAGTRARRLLTPLLAALLIGLPIAGCGASAPPATTGSAPSAPATPAAAPLTSAGYQDLLTQTNDQLASALAAVKNAPSLGMLVQAVLAAAAVASSSGERLTTSGGVPEGVTQENAALAAGLSQFGRELAYLSQQINLHAICTGPTAFDAITTAPSTPQLRAAAAALATPGPNHPAYHWGSALPPPTDAPHTMLTNGTLLVDRRGGARGDGVLAASNDGGTDAVVVLAQSGAAVLSLTVTAGHSAQAEGVPDGDYDLYYTAGNDWDAQLSTFSRHCEFHRFTQPTTFRTGSAPGGSTYTVQSIALHTPPNPGNGPVSEQTRPETTPATPGTAEVPADQFPH